MKALNRTEDEFVLPLTPLLDVVFLLLVFFLVSTSFVKRESSIDIKLPTAEEASQPVKKHESIVVNVRENGVIVVDGRVLGHQALRKTLEDAQNVDPEVSVVIRGDRKVFHNDIVRIMNASLAAGVVDMSIAVFDTEDE